MNFKLAPQYLFALVLLLCLLLGYLFYMFLIQPRQAAISDLNGQIEGKQLVLDRQRSNLARLPALEREVAGLQGQNDAFTRALPQSAQFGQVVANLRQTVEASGAQLTTLSFAAGQAPAGEGTLPPGVQPIGMSLNVSGTFPQLFQVVRALELQNRFTTVSSVGLSGAATGAGAGAAAAPLQGDLSLTVYTFDPQLAASASTPDPNAPAQAPAAAPTGGNP